MKAKLPRFIWSKEEAKALTPRLKKYVQEEASIWGGFLVLNVVANNNLRKQVIQIGRMLESEQT